MQYAQALFQGDETNEDLTIPWIVLKDTLTLSNVRPKWVSCIGFPRISIRLNIVWISQFLRPFCPLVSSLKVQWWPNATMNFSGCAWTHLRNCSHTGPHLSFAFQPDKPVLKCIILHMFEPPPFRSARHILWKLHPHPNFSNLTKRDDRHQFIWTDDISKKHCNYTLALSLWGETGLCRSRRKLDKSEPCGRSVGRYRFMGSHEDMITAWGHDYR